MPRLLRLKGDARKKKAWCVATPRLPPASDLRSQRRLPASDEEIVSRLNVVLEAEQAGVEAAAVLCRLDARGVTDTELKKFGEDEAAACAGLRQAVLRYSGKPSDRAGDLCRKLLSLQTEWERLMLLAREQTWVVERLDGLLGMPLDPETQGFLAEMREEHLENVDAFNRRAEELTAPPSPPYRTLEYAALREAHDRLYYGSWRNPEATDREHQRAYFQLGRYLGLLTDEVQRARSLEARNYLARARAAYAEADREAGGQEMLRGLDNALSYAHTALNALLRQYRAPTHDPRDFESFYDVVAIPFQELI